MPIFNVTPYGFLYTFKIEAKDEEQAFKKMEYLLKEMDISDEEIEFHLSDAIIEDINF